MKYVYLHGFASSPASRKATFFRQRMADHGIDLNVPALDEGDFTGLTVSRQLRLIEKIVGNDPCRLIGSSLGGYVATLFAARHENVDSVLAMAPALAFAKLWRDQLGEEKMREWEQTGSMTVYHYGEDKDREIGFELMKDGFSYEDYPDINQRALVIHGRRDDVVPIMFSEKYCGARPGKRRLVILESDHGLSDSMEEIWAEAENFFFQNS
jgi:hypothetical protein